MDTDFHKSFIDFVRTLYAMNDFIPLHSPSITEAESDCVAKVLESTFVSSVGEYVNRVESQLCELTGSKFAVATCSGTAALHVGLRMVGVEPQTEVLTQALSFVATCNAIRYQFAEPVFLDIDEQTLGLSPIALERFLSEKAELRDEGCFNRHTGRRIAACVPMHVFGLPVGIRAIKEVCDRFRVPLVEDAAESLGSYEGDLHTGLTGAIGAVSFNGNKIVTAGGGGAILTQDEQTAVRAKHLTTMAKLPHSWEYVHDEVGYNYRMPNLNAALLSAQLTRLPEFLQQKARLASVYSEFFQKINGARFVEAPPSTKPNNWLNAILFEARDERESFLEATNSSGVMTRPSWKSLNELAMYQHCETDGLEVTKRAAKQLVNIPSGIVGLTI